jgi:hypothetical protein
MNNFNVKTFVISISVSKYFLVMHLFTNNNDKNLELLKGKQ